MRKKALKPGDVMKDGSIYAGISPHTKGPFYLVQVNKVLMTFNEASDAGYKKYLLMPLRSELSVLAENSEKGALKGLFNKTGLFPAGIVWSRENFYFISFDAKTLRMSDGKKCHYKKTRKLSSCFIRY